LKPKLLSAKNLVATLLVGSLNLLVLGLGMAPWLVGIALLAPAVRLFLFWRHLPPPPKRVIFVANVISIALVYFGFNGTLSFDAGLAFLALTAATKLLEMNTYRDAMIALQICFYLLLLRVLDSQSIGDTLFTLVDSLLITGTIFMLHSHDQVIGKVSRKSAKFVIQAIPLAIILFFIFPRFSAGFWPIRRAQHGSMGFSGEMRPGSITQLSPSNEVAFRASFEGGLFPPMEGRYWRGNTLSLSRGLEWEAGPISYPESDAVTNAERTIYQHSIVLEPRFGNWLFALDVPTRLLFSDDRKQSQIERYPGRTFRSTRTVSQRIIYQAISMHAPKSQRLSENERKAYLQIPPISDRFNELIQNFQQELTSENAIVSTATSLTSGTRFSGSQRKAVTKVLQHFATDGLKPPPVSSMDQFLFRTKEGYCEHFSGAAGTILRAMGLPTRVVLGFQGGEPNNFDDFLTITDRDAHAWIEVWLDDESAWARFDPTASVAETRLAFGGQLFSMLEPDQLNAKNLYANDLRELLASKWGVRFRDAFQAMTNQWNLLLLSYDYSAQNELFGLLGLAINRTVLLVLSVGATIGFVFWLQYRNRARKRIDGAEKIFNQLCMAFGRNGIPYLLHEGPRTYLNRCIAAHPNLRADLEGIGNLYMEIRYSKTQKRRASIRLLKRRWRRLKFKLKEQAVFKSPSKSNTASEQPHLPGS
jgi:protein-glutamine gamma-glutamyltransferase